MNEPLEHSDPVETFRRRTSRSSSVAKEPLSRRGRLILISLTVQIVFLGWSMGGLRVWSVITLFVLNAIGFLLLFIPLGNQEPSLDSPQRPLTQLLKLLSWPFFWCGLLFLLYTVIQNLNPAWEYTLREGRVLGWITGVEYIDWLPTGVIAPFETMNGWRALMIFASALMLVSTVWCGVTRRQHLIYLLWVSVLSTTSMVVVGLIQRFTHTREMLWFIENIPGYFFGTFTYKNHAGAFIGLNIAVALGLAVYYLRQSRRQLTKSSPYLFLVMLALLLVIGVFFSDSRAAMVVMVGVCSSTLILFIIAFLKHGSGRGSLLLGMILTLLGGAFAALLFSFLNLDRIEQRLAVVLDDVRQLEGGSPENFSHSTKQRYHIYLATWEMVKDNPWWGWGAGGYRYYFPAYQKKYPEIRYFERTRWLRDKQTGEKKRVPQRTYFNIEHAHSDWLQYPAEYGVVGCGIGLLGYATLIVSGLIRWRRIRIWMLVCMIGCGGTLIHGLVDFVFQCPSIVLLWILLPVVIVKYIHLSDRIMERQRQRQKQGEEADVPRRLSLRPEPVE